MLRYLAILITLVSSPTLAQEWELLRDDAFGYELPIPAEYALSLRPENSNARLYHNPQGDLLAVWAAPLDDQGFVQEIDSRQQQDARSGWDITYERITPEWASYSGVLGDQIRYVRAIRYCGDRAAFFSIDYRRDEKERYDPIVTHMVRRMQPIGNC